MILETDRRYVRRDGGVTGPLRVAAQPTKRSPYKFYDPDFDETYNPDGVYCRKLYPHAFDLTRELLKEETVTAPLPLPQPPNPMELTELSPPEDSRSYHYADGTCHTFTDVTHFMNSKTTHRLKADGGKTLVIVERGWRFITINAEAFTL